MSTKLLRETRKIELVETHNIALSLDRLYATPTGHSAWKRAFYHALAMSNASDYQLLQRVRAALELP